MSNPRFPVYIVSKGRWKSRLTALCLDEIGVPFHIVVEPQEHDDYAAVIDDARILVLPILYRDQYDTFDALGDTKGKGPGPARNYVWDHARAAGADWHWVLDDNIRDMYRLYKNTLIRMGDGTCFRIMEDFCLRYRNVGMAGPNYELFVPRRKRVSNYVLNTRIYSCNLIRNDAPFRWRGRYNEDTDLSLRMLKAGWCTVLFNAFLQKKIGTQKMAGGNTTEFYAREGTLPKSKMLVAMHPDVTRLMFRFHRWHHYVDYRPFARNKLALRDGVQIAPGVNDYGLTLQQVPA